MTASFDESFDVVVVGSGAGALVGAYTAAERGARTLLVESTDRFGGTTAYSGGGLWLPGNPAELRAGIEDGPDQGLAYLRSVIGDQTASLQNAFVHAGPRMIADLERHPLIEFEHQPFPDYFADAPNCKPAGRAVFPLRLSRAEAGTLAESLRAPLPVERAGAAPSDELTNGQALIARLLLAAESTGRCELRLNTAFDRFLVDGEGSVIGVECTGPDGRTITGCSFGVLLAAGGFERNDSMRQRYGTPGRAQWSMGGPGSLGRPIEAAVEVGAACDLMDECWWAPGVEHADGSVTFTLGFRGGIFVNSSGVRFANESLPYDQFGRAVVSGDGNGRPHLPFWMIFDGRFGDALPALSTSVPVDADALKRADLWRTANSIEDLARFINVPVDQLVATVNRFNRAAAAGVDDEFDRGQTPFDLFFATGDGPNAALVPISEGPFHAVRFGLSDLGTKGGLVTDAKGRVLKSDGTPIVGMYAAGNTMASMSRHTYPGPGIPIGSSMVFSYLAALDMTGSAEI